MRLKDKKHKREEPKRHGKKVRPKNKRKEGTRNIMLTVKVEKKNCGGRRKKMTEQCGSRHWQKENRE